MAGLDLKGIYNSFRQGQQEARQNRLADLDELGRSLQGQVLAGDKSKLPELIKADSQRGMQTKQYMTAQQKAETAEFLQAAYSADTPEKWQSVVDRFRARGHQFDDGEDNFANRASLLSEGQTIAEQQNIKWRETEAARDQGNTDRAYNLQRISFDADQQWRKTQADLEQKKLNAAAPDLVEMYDGPTGQPYKAQWNPKTSTFDRVGGVKAPSGTQLDVTLPDGTVIRQGAQKNLTEGQSKDLVYLTRMADAVPIIDQMGDQLLSLGENVGGNVPVIGNYLKSPEYQQAEQAAGQWRQGFLRKDSGATITDDETADTNRLYIPQPGDKGPVLRQKAQARRMATLAVKMGLPPQAVMEMQKNGIDLDKILKAPLPSGDRNSADAKGDMQPQSEVGKTRRGITFEVGQ